MSKHIKLQRRPTKRFFIIILAVMLLITGLGAYTVLRPKVMNAVTLEAGSQMVDVDAFLRDDKTEASFVTDTHSLDMNEPGTHEIEIQIGKKLYTSQLVILDTEPPAGTSVDIMVLKGDEIKADAFVKEISDATEVTASFVGRPNTRKAGKFKVTIQLTDAGNNKTSVDANLTVLEVKETVQVEAGVPLNLTTTDFVNHGEWPVSLVTHINALDVSQPTEYPVELRINNKIVASKIVVADTTPPKAMATDREIYLEQTLTAEDFVSDITDVSEVTCSFLRNPNFTKVGATEVTIVLTDTYGNKSQYPVSLTIKKDLDPPVFTGIKELVIYEGQAVSYKNDVSAKDEKDGPVNFTVNSGKVNTRKPGVYELQYIAEDAAGNKATDTTTVKVLKLEASEEVVYAMADEILEKITKPDMTQKDVAYAIYKYVNKNIAYTGSSAKDDVIKEAFRAVKFKAGDCFTYYSLSEVLLTRAGIENMMVTRVGGKTQHFWSMINVGTGWYHFDSTPHSEAMETFMMTDARVDYFTERWGRNYYVYDRTKYPATPSE